MIVIWLLCSLLAQSNNEIACVSPEVYLERLANVSEITYSKLEVTDIANIGNSSDEIVSFLIVLEEGLYNVIGADLMEIWADVILSEGNFNRVKIVEINYAAPIEIRAYLQTLYISWGLEGVVLVGDIPYAVWEGICDYPDSEANGADNYDYHNFPSDYYYADLDDNISMWQDTKKWVGGQWISGSNGLYDYVNTFAGNAIFPDIYCGRICLSKTPVFDSGSPYEPAIRDECFLIQEYLRRSLEFRVNPPSLPHRAILYVDDRDDLWDEDTWDKMYDSFRCLYGASEILWNQQHDACHDHYMVWLASGCEWMWVRGHANNSSHAWENPPSTQSSSLVPGESSETIPKARFISLNGCHNGNFTAEWNMGSIYLLLSEWACGVVAQTSEGWGLAGHHASDGDPFFSAIADGKTVGYAFREMCQERNITAPYGFAWEAMIEMIYLGDPSIMPEMHYVTIR